MKMWQLASPISLRFNSNLAISCKPSNSFQRQSFFKKSCSALTTHMLPSTTQPCPCTTSTVDISPRASSICTKLCPSSNWLLAKTTLKLAASISISVWCTKKSRTMMQLWMRINYIWSRTSQCMVRSTSIRLVATNTWLGSTTGARSSRKLLRPNKKLTLSSRSSWAIRVRSLLPLSNNWTNICSCLLPLKRRKPCLADRLEKTRKSWKIPNWCKPWLPTLRPSDRSRRMTTTREMRKRKRQMSNAPKSNRRWQPLKSIRS